MSKRFTLPEAEGLLPQVDKLMQEAVRLKTQLDEAEASLQSFVQRIMILGGVVVDREPVKENKARRDRSASQLQGALEAIQEFGCVVKDLDTGLVDFPTLFRGEEVFLCWKLGESGIRFWHGLHEGFAGRKRIDEDFLEHHQGDPAN